MPRGQTRKRARLSHLPDQELAKIVEIVNRESEQRAKVERGIIADELEKIVKRLRTQ